MGCSEAKLRQHVDTYGARGREIGVTVFFQKREDENEGKKLVQLDPGRLCLGRIRRMRKPAIARRDEGGNGDVSAAEVTRGRQGDRLCRAANGNGSPDTLQRVR